MYRVELYVRVHRASLFGPDRRFRPQFTELGQINTNTTRKMAFGTHPPHTATVSSRFRPAAMLGHSSWFRGIHGVGRICGREKR